jgi:hypothetical protein
MEIKKHSLGSVFWCLEIEYEKDKYNEIDEFEVGGK